MSQLDSGSTGGYDANFDPPLPDTHECPICKLALRDAMQTVCGHRFCQSCILTWKRNRATFECPCDKQELRDRDFHPDNFCRREVLSLKVVCQHREDCNWHGELRDLQGHLNECLFQKISCPNACESAGFLRRDLSHHIKNECPLRKCNCPNCHREIFFKDTAEHERECPEMSVPCEFCEEDVLRKNIDDHHQMECLEIELKCTFFLYGCPFKDKRMKLDGHIRESTPDHLHLLLDEHCRFCNEVGKKLGTSHQRELLLQKRVEELKKENSEKTETIHRMQQKFSQQDEELQQLRFGLDEMRWQLSKLQGQSARTEQHWSEKQATVNQQLVSHDERLSIVEEQSGSRNGQLLWPIHDFSRAQAEAHFGRTEYIESRVFYTHDRYKLRARLYPNGHGLYRGTHLSLYLAVMRSDVDSVLTWPFIKRVKFSLLNQKGRSAICEEVLIGMSNSASSRPVREMTSPSGCPQFGCLATICDTTQGFLENDKIVLSVEVLDD